MVEVYKWTSTNTSSSSSAFCSYGRFFCFCPSCSFVYWMTLLKLSYCMIWSDLPISQSCSWNESQRAALVQRCRSPLSLAIEERTRLYSHAKTTVSNRQMQLRILFDLCPRCQALQNTSEFHIYLRKKNPKNVDTVLRIHSGKNAAVDEFSLV